MADAEEKKRCMICAKTVTAIKVGICKSCQERIQREAMVNRQISGIALTKNYLDRVLRRPGKRPDLIIDYRL